MNCKITYLRTQEEKIVAVMEFEKNRDDDPDVCNVISKQPKGCCCVDSPLRAESGSLESEPFETIEDAQEWAEKKLKETKGKIEVYRMSKQID
ncbi:hypothetical protein ACFLWC_00855 [Chloroflexota bacterium]